MKNLISIIIISIFSITSCYKKVKLSDLPPITTVGANTFGCLVNGNGLIPRSYSSGKPLALAYFHDTASIFRNTFNNTGFTGKLYDLFITAGDYTLNSPVTLLLEAQGLDLKTGDKIPIVSKLTPNSIFGSYYINGFVFGYSQPVVQSNTITYKSILSSSNLLTVVKRDSVNHILSCTFSFDAADTLGNIVQIRDGRFDIQTH